MIDKPKQKIYIAERLGDSSPLHFLQVPLVGGRCEKIDYILLPVVVVCEPETVSAGSIDGRKLCEMVHPSVRKGRRGVFPRLIHGKITAS
jgi:hypothetical protein